MIHATTALALRKLSDDYRRVYSMVDKDWYQIKKAEIVKNFMEVVRDENTAPRRSIIAFHRQR